MQNPDPLCRVLTSGSPSSGDRRRRQSAAAGRLAIAERRIVRRRVERRGVVLVFVVVLLTLLGIMGTAYLATSRIDRQSIVTGRGALPNATTPLLRDARRLDTIAASVERAAKGQLVRDLFNIAPQYALDSTEFGNYAFATFRETLPGIDPRSGVSLQTSWYEDYDAPGRADAWLSSLLATRTPGSPDVYQWPWISAPLGTEMAPNLEAEPFFSDPRFMSASGITAANRYAWFNKDGLNEPNPPAAPTTPSLRPADPLNAPVTQRHNVQIASGDPNTTGGPVTLIRPANAEGKPWDTTRVYPSFIIESLPGSPKYIAADADGDGIADSGLSPVVLDASPAVDGTINRYLDPINNVVYFAAYRIVDNSAKLNLTTALNQRGDLVNLEISGNPGANEADDGAAGPLNASAPSEIREFLTEDPTVNVPPNGTWGPNYGFFRSNVGLTGVIRDLLAPINQATDPNDFNRVPAQQELRRLIDARFPLLKQNPNSEYMDLPGEGASFEKYDIHRVAATFTGPAYAEFRSGTALEPNPGGPDVGTWGEYLFRSFGDLTEQLVARRPGDPGSYLWSNAPRGGTPAIVPSLSPDTFRWFGTGDAASLAVKNGALVNGLLSPGAGENALSFTLRYSAPNVANNGDEPWGFFPPDAVELWHGWTQDFGVDASATPVASASILPIAAIDATAANDRAFTFTAPGGTGLANVRLPRSPRALFTTYSGVTTTVPKRGDGDVFIAAVNEAPTPGLPIGMPAYSAAESRTAPPPNGNGREIASSVQGTDPVIPGVEFVYPAAKVSAATGSKEELWRAFWSVMTQTHPFQYDQGAGLPSRVSYFWDAARPLESKLPSQNISGDAKYATIEWDATYDPSRFYEAFRSSDRHPSDESVAVADAQRPYLPDVTTNPSREYNEQLKPTQVLSTRQMALIRSAVAACNTIDLRDNDDDITAMNVDITDDNTIGRGQAGDPTISAATPRYYARVYGTEKQLVISGVYLEPGSAAIEIYNPSDVPIKLSAYHLAMVNRTPGANPKLNGVIATLPAVPPIRLGDNLGNDPVANAGGFVQPGGYVILSAGAPAGITISPATAHPPPAGTPDVHSIVLPGPMEAALNAVGGRTQELALFRTRRADGNQFEDDTAVPAGGVRDTIENEFANNAAGVADLAGNVDVLSLVPVDAVDCRFVLPAGAYRMAYTRGLPGYQGPGGTAAAPLTGALAQDEAWRCFYAGEFYPLRAAGARNFATNVDTLPQPEAERAAWRNLTGAPVTFGDGIVRLRDPLKTRTEPNAILAPAIPIQNFTPFDPYVNTPSRPLTTGTAAQPLSARYSRYGYNEYINAAGTDPTLRGLFHFVNRFPFGTPFARELDVTSIPFIGSYKIYRQSATTAGSTVLYEYVPLPMDAWAVASNPAEVVPETQLPPPAPLTPEIKTVGRFVPLFPVIDEATYTANNRRADRNVEYPPKLRNEWAASLTTFVTARQSKQKVYLPDIADSGNGPRFHLIPDPTVPIVQYHLQDQRYVQDGPVLSSSQPALPLDNNPFQDVRWVSFTERNTAVTDPQLNTGLGWGEGERQGLPVEDNRVSALTQGVININTAPEFVLRQLPWVVNPATGQVDYAAGDPLDDHVRRLTHRLTEQRAIYEADPWEESPSWTLANVRREQGKSFAFTSLMDLNAFSPWVAQPTTTPLVSPTIRPEIDATVQGQFVAQPGLNADPAAYMRLGMMNPIGRNEQDADYQVEQANINRISNLAGTRSDAYTVYVTVQAWTYAPALGGTQATQTRLVGERRSAFIVDRSRVSQTNFDPSTALISIPVERE